MNEEPAEPLYDERDIVALGEHYTMHVQAMTDYGLHEKSDIAAELAYRDREIEKLTDAYYDTQHQLDETATKLDRCRALVDQIDNDVYPEREPAESVQIGRNQVADELRAILDDRFVESHGTGDSVGVTNATGAGKAAMIQSRPAAAEEERGPGTDHGRWPVSDSVLLAAYQALPLYAQEPDLTVEREGDEDYPTIDMCIGCGFPRDFDHDGTDCPVARIERLLTRNSARDSEEHDPEQVKK